MHWIDWVLISLPLLLLTAIVLYTGRYMNGVADFLSGRRLAGRYLLAVAKGEMAAGAAVFVAMFEIFSKSAFSLSWWGWIQAPVFLIVTISGFVIYRYRETRAMTLAQFFEIRYNKSFRVFTGILGFGAGLVNFGIIPAVGARFLVYFMGLPTQFQIGTVTLPTYIPLMAVLLAITLILTLSGGLITLMVTNCLEGMITQVLFLVLIIGLLYEFNWGQIHYALTHIVTATGIQERPPGQSLLNPFDSLALKDFNIWYVLMTMLVGIYGTMAWQNQSAYNSAAISAHEARMGGILGTWRNMVKGPVITLLCVCAMAFLIHPDFATQSETARTEIAQLGEGQIKKQMEIPIAVVHMLPVGLKGALCIILIMGVCGGDGGHLHSWGSLFIQDVLIPLRKKALTPEEHIAWLRWSVSGVALFAFIFGSLFHQTEYIVMWWNVTMALYIGGAGAVIIGGLYWKKGTVAGAWTAMLTGSGLSTGGILARQVYGDTFPLNGTEIGFYATLIAILLYVVVSLLTCTEDFDLDRMLHRNQHAEEALPQTPTQTVSLWSRLIGVDENFTTSDKWITGVLFGWSMFWFAVFVVGTIWNLISPWPLSVWSEFWYVASITIPMILALVGTFWFIWGGWRDMRTLFRLLRESQTNSLDNGMVVNHHNLDEIVPSQAQELVDKK